LISSSAPQNPFWFGVVQYGAQRSKPVPATGDAVMLQGRRTERKPVSRVWASITSDAEACTRGLTRRLPLDKQRRVAFPASHILSPIGGAAKSRVAKAAWPSMLELRRPTSPRCFGGCHCIKGENTFQVTPIHSPRSSPHSNHVEQLPQYPRCQWIRPRQPHRIPGLCVVWRTLPSAVGHTPAEQLRLEDGRQ
jgi:hypothetical protein